MMGGMMMGGSQGLNTLLNQMDSLASLVEDRWRYKLLRWFGLVRGPVNDKPLVFVIGATNRPNVLTRADPTRSTRPPDHRPRTRLRWPARHHLHYLSKSSGQHPDGSCCSPTRWAGPRS